MYGFWRYWRIKNEWINLPGVEVFLKKIIKISIIVIVTLVLLISLTGFLILKTDSWKTVLVNFTNRQLMQNFNLKIEPEGISGNIFYHLKIDRLKLTNQNQTELVTMSGVNLSYNLKSLIGHNHILNKLSLTLSSWLIQRVLIL